MTGADTTFGGIIAVGDNVYFAADTNNEGRELWRSDGTEANTIMIGDFAPGKNGSSLKEMAAYQGALYVVGGLARTRP